MKQPSVQYATTDDGIRIAYLESGEGRPLVQFPNFFNHALLHWRWSVMAQSTTALAKRFRLVQFDSRGQGLSGRRLGDNHVLDDYIRDVEAIVNQLGLRHFSIYSRTHFAHVAARYAIKHPALVDALVFEDSRNRQALQDSRAGGRGGAEMKWQANARLCRRYLSLRREPGQRDLVVLALEDDLDRRTDLYG